MNKPANLIRGDETQSPVFKKSWDRYLETLQQLRIDIENCSNYMEAPDQRGMGLRHLMEVQAMTYNFTVAPRVRHPRMYRSTAWQTDFYSIGGNGPDFDYRTAFLDSAHTYRLTGKMNDSRMVLAQMNSATPGQPNSRCMANFDFHEFNLGEDGSFDVIISVEKQEGNWIPMDPEGGYQWLFIRPTVETWDEVPAEFNIERLGDLPEDDLNPLEYSEEAVAKRIDLATSFMHYVVTEWAINYVPFIEGKAGGKNAFMTLGLIGGGELGNPAAHYQHCVYEVNDDEALILEFDEEPQGSYWSLQLYDIWHRAIPFRTKQATLSGKQMVKDSDGKIRVVISRQDPGIHNWLDNNGVSIGEVAWRIYQVTKNPNYKFIRIPFDQLDQYLPRDTKLINSEERARELKLREDAYKKRFGE